MFYRLRDDAEIGYYVVDLPKEHLVYYAANAKGEEIAISPEVFEALYDMRGVVPLNIAKEDEDMLLKYDIIDNRRIIRKKAQIEFVLHSIGDIDYKSRRNLQKVSFCVFVLSFFLQVAALLSLIGCPIRITSLSIITDSRSIIALVFYVACCMLFHEMGHAIVAASHGVVLGDIRLVIKYCIFIIANVEMAGECKKPWHNIQIYLAGVVFELIITSATQLIRWWCFPQSQVLEMLIIFSIVSDLLNCLPINGLDGYEILQNMKKAKVNHCTDVYDA